MAIQDLLPNYDLASQLGINLRGNETKHAPCPFCGGHDRFAIKRSSTANKQIWMCNQCHPKWGDAIEFVKQKDGVTFSEAVFQLGGKFTPQQKPTLKRAPLPAAVDYDTPPAQQWQTAAHVVIQECEAALWLPRNKKILDYVRKRGLTDETIKAYRLGYCSTGTANEYARNIGDLYIRRGIIIPTIVYNDIWQIRIRLFDGVPFLCSGCKAVLTRTGECPHCRAKNKYKGVTGNKIGLMGADMLAAAHTAIICAGEFDSMLAQQYAPAGVACVTFGSETKKLSLRWQIALRKITRLIVAYDNDDAGDKGFTSVREIVPNALRARVPKGKDMGEYLSGGGDIGAWISEITGTGHDDIDAAVLEWLDTAGYAPEIAADGRICAKRSGYVDHTNGTILGK